MKFDFKKTLVIFVLFLIALFVCFEILRREEKIDIPLEVNYLDIGQGDATLINYLGRYQILIDGGPNGKKVLSELGKVMSPFDHKIEMVILTHPDQDHLAGLIDVLQNYEVGVFLQNGQNAETNIFQQLQKIVSEKQVRSEFVLEGSTFSIGENLDFKIFNPDFREEADKDRNEQSIVVRMDFGENSFLFTGDAEESAEADMISDQENLDVDWLKTGHHGSKSSTSEKFLEVVTPKYAIISAGKGNRYGHPNKETLQRLEEIGAKIFRTDEQGTVVVDCLQLQEACFVK
jgi:competence protein ComEC